MGTNHDQNTFSRQLDTKLYCITLVESSAILAYVTMHLALPNHRSKARMQSSRNSKFKIQNSLVSRHFFADIQTGLPISIEPHVLVSLSSFTAIRTNSLYQNSHPTGLSPCCYLERHARVSCSSMAFNRLPKLGHPHPFFMLEYC